MLKKFIAMICAFAMLASCSTAPSTSNEPSQTPSTAPSEPPSTAPSDGQTTAPSPSPTVEPSPTLSPEPIEITPHYTTGRGDLMDGLFTVRLPESWRDKYIVEYDETDTTYGLSFYQKAAKDAGFGGWLFTLTSFPEDIDYSQYPQYDLVGAIRSAGGFDEHLVAIYPSDVQFDEPQREQYTAMYADIPSILAGITVADGCELISKDELNLWSYDIPENHGLDSSVTAIMFGIAVEQGYIDPDLDRPIVRTPGTFFNYTTGGTHLLGAITEQ